MIRTQIAASWFGKLIIRATVPTLLRVAINEASDHLTADAADRPPMHMLNQMSAVIALWLFAAPRMPNPQVVPATRTVFRTEFAFHPRSISASTSQPPTARSATVATSHGTPV